MPLVTDVSSHLNEERLNTALTELSLELTSSKRKSLLRYLVLLNQWNRVYNLSAVRDPEQMLVQHLLDCLAVVSQLEPLARAANPKPLSSTCPTGTQPTPPGPTPPGPTPPGATPPGPTPPGPTSHVWDIGSGAGLPGLILAIVWPDRQIHTVDSVGKKIAFQQHVIGDLGLRNARAIHSRVEQLQALTTPDLIVCRAFTSLARFAESCQAIAGQNTSLAAMKGKYPQAEIDELSPGWTVRQSIPVIVPGLDAQRHLIIMSKR